MGDEGGKDAGPAAASGPEGRRARLAEAMRANLRRRKEQRRAREAGSPAEKGGRPARERDGDG